MKNWILEINEKKPILLTAIHNGHYVRPSLKRYMKITEEQRLYEEDPYTCEFTTIYQNRLCNYLSRFEVDVNRPKEKAFYLEPEDAWGLDIWENKPPEEEIRKSLEKYNQFYKNVEETLNDFKRKYKRFLVLDIHSYNYKRNNKIGDPSLNPDINVGTGTMKNKPLCSDLINTFITEFSKYKINNKNLDVRENIKFKGGYFPKWIHENYKEHACVLSIEFKKLFMEELTGELDGEILKKLKFYLKETLKKMEKIL